MVTRLEPSDSDRCHFDEERGEIFCDIQANQARRRRFLSMFEMTISLNTQNKKVRLLCPDFISQVYNFRLYLGVAIKHYRHHQHQHIFILVAALR